MNIRFYAIKFVWQNLRNKKYLESQCRKMWYNIVCMSLPTTTKMSQLQFSFKFLLNKTKNILQLYPNKFKMAKYLCGWMESIGSKQLKAQL